MTLISTVGGASGPLYGTLFLRLCTAVTGKTELSTEDGARHSMPPFRRCRARGKAEPGDKTMIDALHTGRRRAARVGA